MPVTVFVALVTVVEARAEVRDDALLEAVVCEIGAVGQPAGREPVIVDVMRRVVIRVKGQAVTVTVSPTWKGSIIVG